MAAILGPVRRRRGGDRPVNYYVTEGGRAYRVCATSYGRVLMVMLKHKHVEQPIDIAGKRAEAILKVVAEKHHVTLKVPRMDA